MPFQSPYNEMIANKVNKINKKMLVRRKEPISFLPEKNHDVVQGNYFNMGLPDNAGPITGRGRAVGAGLKDIYNKGKFIYDEAKNFYKKPVSRGLHYASKIADHYGYGRSGGGVNKYADRIPYFPAGSTGELGMLGNGSSGGGIFGNVSRGVGSIADAFGLGKRPKQQKGAGIFGNVARGVGSISDAFGLGKKPKQPKQKGAGIFGDIARGIGQGADIFGFGKKRKKSVAHPEDFAMIDRVNSHGSYGGKRPNKRADLVKKVMREKGCSMIQASKFIKKEGLPYAK